MLLSGYELSLEKEMKMPQARRGFSAAAKSLLYKLFHQQIKDGYITTSMVRQKYLNSEDLMDLAFENSGIMTADEHIKRIIDCVRGMIKKYACLDSESQENCGKNSK